MKNLGISEGNLDTVLGLVHVFNVEKGLFDQGIKLLWKTHQGDGFWHMVNHLSYLS